MDLLTKLRDDLAATYTNIIGSNYRDAAVAFANAILDSVSLSGVFFAGPETEGVAKECLTHLDKIKAECEKPRAIGDGTFLNFIKDILPTILAFIASLLKTPPAPTPVTP